MMILLTAEQKQKIHKIYEDSFQAYCEACGYDSNKHAKQLFIMGKEKIEILIANLDINSLPSDVLLTFDKMRNVTNYFDLRAIEHEERRNEICEIITQLSPHLPIDHQYVTQLCKELGLEKPTPSNPESIATLLKSVPIISNWDFEYNAFVDRASHVDNIPYISVYEVLLSTCEAFLQLVTPLAIELKDKARSINIQVSEELGKQSDFMDKFQSCINLAMGKANYAYGEAIEEVHSVVHVMVDSSIITVWCHEFGHLLQGHLQQPQSHQVEFDADSFAFKIIAREPSFQTLDVWMGLGSFIPFVIIDILETIRNSKSQSHPPAKLRIKKGIELYKVENPDVVLPAISFLRSLAAVCNPTLNKHWGVSLIYDNIAFQS